MIPAGSTTPVAIGGTGFSQPIGVAVDASDNLYITNYNNNKLNEINPDGKFFVTLQLPAGLSINATTGTISGTPAGASPATNYSITAYNAGGPTSTTLNIKTEIALPSISYASPQTYNVGAAITPLSPTSSGVAAQAYSGTAQVIGSGFNQPGGVAVDAAGNVYIGDYFNNKVKEIPAGSNTPVVIGAGYSFITPNGLTVDAAGNVYVAARGNGTVVKIPAGGGTPTVLASQGLNGSPTMYGARRCRQYVCNLPGQ